MKTNKILILGALGTLALPLSVISCNVATMEVNQYANAIYDTEFKDEINKVISNAMKKPIYYEKLWETYNLEHINKVTKELFFKRYKFSWRTSTNYPFHNLKIMDLFNYEVVERNVLEGLVMYNVYKFTPKDFISQWYNWIPNSNGTGTGTTYITFTTTLPIEETIYIKVKQ